MPSTATEWLASNPDVEGLEQVLLDNGIEVGFLTEYPDWMKEEIAKKLADSFQQDYWQDIHGSFQGDAEKYLEQGLHDGRSIRQMAHDIAESFGGDGTDAYAKRRAMNIARTESANALNGARKAGMDHLMEDPALSGTMRPTWMSVLGITTRDTHAILDGVPADKDGMWVLSGYRIPHPGHFSLPAGERCGCQCSIVMDLGMQDHDALSIIEAYNLRVDETNKAFEKGNPHHDSTGRFAPKPGSGAGGNQTESAEFKAWFGDSKVVDGGGNPMVVYHGSNKDFDEVKPLTWFSADPALSSRYSEEQAYLQQTQGENVKSVYLKVEKPVEFDRAGQDRTVSEVVATMSKQVDMKSVNKKEALKAIDEFKETHEDGSKPLHQYWNDSPKVFQNLLDKTGFDGIQVNELGVKTYAVLKSNQVKSSISNSGNFDSDDPNINKGLDSKVIY